MKIDVKLFATLRLNLGVASVSVETESTPTVSELFELVSEKVGTDIKPWLINDDGTVKLGTMILLEGHNVHHMEGLDTKVEVSEVAIFPPAGGG